jgi:tetratricopeptide (TPR) repeat protein
MANSKSSEREVRLSPKAPKSAPGALSSPAKAPVLPKPAVRVAPLFRKIDWLTLVLTFGVIFAFYFITLAPELTLEDSGELVTGSMYAGIPHPPGYPVWTIYSWLWTTLVPVGNPAWRVALAEAFLGALACGLLSLMVSRGSSLFMESIEELKNMTGKWENAICMVSGFVAGLLMGLDGFMWKESVAVNRIAVSSVPWFLVVLLCLMRWLYAPHQYRFLYWALFVFGICFTTHQSLIVAAIGVEVAIAAGNQRVGRDVFFGNFVLYMLAEIYLWVTGQQVFSNLSQAGLQVIFHGVGVGSLLASLWLAFKTRTKGIELSRNAALLAALSGLELMLLYKGQSGPFGVSVLYALGAITLFGYLAWKTWGMGREYLVVVGLGCLWILGASFYLYEAVSGMTNPPMEWGYPRTVEGFFHALTRGQYEQPSPTDLLTDPNRFLGQVVMLVQGAVNEFTWVYLLVALVPFLFFFKLQKRERAWVIGLGSIYLCLGVLLIILLNPTPDRASADLIKVFFCNSHTIVAAMIGYGMALTAAFMATHYQRFRLWGVCGGAVAVVLGLYSLYDITGTTYAGPAGEIGFSHWLHWIGMAFEPHHYGLPIFGGLVLVAVPLLFTLALVWYRERGPLFITLGLFLAMPVYSGLAHWFPSNQHNHYFGYWFGHDMFTPPFKGKDGKPIYPEMAPNAVLYGGTDPGRFCPTYMIFCESFTPHNCQPAEDQHFDRRDVYIITQNALADGTYLDYIRAQYNRSTQIDTPFFQDLLRSAKEKEMNYETNFLARLVSPLDDIFESYGAKVERKRRTYTSWFKEEDFTDLPGFVARLRSPGPNDPLSKYLYDNLSPHTRELLSGSGDEHGLRSALCEDLNRLLERELVTKQKLQSLQQEKSRVDQQLADGSTSQSLRTRQEALGLEVAQLSKADPLYTPERFKNVQLSEYLQEFIAQNPQSDTRIRLNRLLLEAAYPKLLAKSLGGLYPDREIYIATPEDSQRCFNEYLADAQRRLQHDMQFPNEPRQIRFGEDVKIVDNRVTVAGQVAVMAINGLLTKVMFDHNPKNEFYVEESFPLDWMYPHLTPYGVIMKINRKPLPSLSDEVLQKDHEFWKQYSKRLTGDFIDYDTPISKICDWIEKVYLRHDLTGFTGERKFIHDDDAQKAFSKLRSSIGGIYAWRLTQAPPQYRPKTPEEFQHILREAEFTFRQAFAFCPYSPEAVFRYVQLLTQMPGRIDDALLIAHTCEKLDPYNPQVTGLIQNLEAIKAQQASMTPSLQATIDNAKARIAAHDTNQALQMLDSILRQPGADYRTIVEVAQLYGDLRDWDRLETALERLVKVAPDSPEAWYDLAAMKANRNKLNEALPALERALDLNAKRLKQNPAAHDLRVEARNDGRFAALRTSPEFQKLVPPK